MLPSKEPSFNRCSCLSPQKPWLPPTSLANGAQLPGPRPLSSWLTVCCSESHLGGSRGPRTRPSLCASCPRRSSQHLLCAWHHPSWVPCLLLLPPAFGGQGSSALCGGRSGLHFSAWWGVGEGVPSRWLVRGDSSRKGLRPAPSPSSGTQGAWNLSRAVPI